MIFDDIQMYTDICNCQCLKIKSLDFISIQSNHLDNAVEYIVKCLNIGRCQMYCVT